MKVSTLINFLCMLFCISHTYAQPNDNCATATVIPIPNAGFGIGVTSSPQSNLTTATVQAGEIFAPAIIAAGQSSKSVWYKFTLPTHRAVRVSLMQNGTVITAGDVGFAVYKASTCLPTNAQISTKLTPISVFGSTYHPCVEPGDYYVQVSSKQSTTGSIFIDVKTELTNATYDNPVNAYNFGNLAVGTKIIDYDIDCQSIENSAETCPSLPSAAEYTKSTWHVFKTPNYFDLISLFIDESTYSIFTAGIKIYEGDVRTGNYTTMPVAFGCSPGTKADNYKAIAKYFRCNQLSPNKTYSIQLFFKKDFEKSIRVALSVSGSQASNGPQPITTSIVGTNNIGNLATSAATSTTTLTDRFACAGIHNGCGPTVPTAGVTFNSKKYNVSSFFRFNLTTTSNIALDATTTMCNASVLIRLYKQDVTSACNGLLLTNKIYEGYGFTQPLNCLDPGNYTIQVLGQDSIANNNIYYWSFNNSTTPVCYASDLGVPFTLTIKATTINASNAYSLSTNTAYKPLNATGATMNPLVPGVTYNSTDIFGCSNTVMPAGNVCSTANKKAIYTEFVVTDSGMMTYNLTSTPFDWNKQVESKLYAGNAASLSATQNVHNYPQTISGLNAMTNCVLEYNYSCDPYVCITPGTYTLVALGDTFDIGKKVSTDLKFFKRKTIHHSPTTAENMGNLITLLNNNNGWISSAVDSFSCYDNAQTIAGIAPCTINGMVAKKAIYREFYLSSAAEVSIQNSNGSCASSYMILFKGRASLGIGTLQAMPTPWQCFYNYTSPSCQALGPGWYTVVSYGVGPSYANPIQQTNATSYPYANNVGQTNQIQIYVKLACPGPKYNRPFKAAIDTVTNQPFLIQWGPRVGHTAAYPKTDTTYTLYQENLNCTVDTPFAAHHLPACDAAYTKVTYYVFKTTQLSYIRIDDSNNYSYINVYKGNARTDSATFSTATQIQPCVNISNHIQLCNLEPGVYTLVIFTNSYANCTSVTPKIYIDRVGYSRFDHAQNAYDFGTIPPDSVLHWGKLGDVNPQDPSRKPSSDFFYCTTGAQQFDPADATCNTDYLPNIYPNTRLNYPMYTNNSGNYRSIPRRNLWYSFVVKEGGYVTVKVQNKTLGDVQKKRIAVYKSNVNGTLPFSTIQTSGALDSTILQGLTFIAENKQDGYYCYTYYDTVMFYRNPCTSGMPERYYVVVDNNNYYGSSDPYPDPAKQIEVAVGLDSINAILPIGDHYSQAQSIGNNLGAGTYVGPLDNYSCATKDGNEPFSYNYNCANRTLWYKFSTTVTGKIKYHIKINGVVKYSTYHHQLFKVITPGDSTATGLLGLPNPTYVNFNSEYWDENCISPGTYYLVLTGCEQVNENVRPEIIITEEKGDFCNAPVVATIVAAGNTSASATIDCHTIGNDYGEYNDTLSCPAGTPKNTYKSTWFKIQINGTDTMDITTYLTETTTAPPDQIKYRLMTGTCGAMQENSCVQDAQTQDTYKCLKPGSYYVQVFTPTRYNNQPVTGTIKLNVQAVPHVDSCAAIPACLATAAFVPQFDCNAQDSAVFTNYSTYGTDISYQWSFGYNNQTSTLAAPKFRYPALTINQTYTIKLVVTNGSCGRKDSVTRTLFIPARPNLITLGNDTTLCTANSLVLDATGLPGTTYYWSTGAITPSITVTSSQGTYYVTATLGSCQRKVSRQVFIDPTNHQNETKAICNGNNVSIGHYSGGASYSWNLDPTPNYMITVAQPGTYIETINWYGCITKDTFNVVLPTEPFTKDTITLCSGNITLDATTPGAQSYAWNTGEQTATIQASNAGSYNVAISFGNCSVTDTVTVQFAPSGTTQSTVANICNGQSYTLPWGNVVSAAGIYTDTLFNALGCDSLVKKVDLRVDTAIYQNFAVPICQGQTYTLPWGESISAPGVYKDTLQNIRGCDSIYYQYTISMATVQMQASIKTICQGASYTLPWGGTASTAGTYADTLRYAGGCDSLIRTVVLTVQAPTTNTSTVVICQGQTHTLPWGLQVGAAGTYRDTLTSIYGCDSLITNVQVVVQAPTTQNPQGYICQGQSFTLPWGQVVNQPGTYRDTLKFAAGCDSLIVAYTLANLPVAQENYTKSICSGETFTTPQGTAITTPGVYTDTLFYAANGCDSVHKVYTVSSTGDVVILSMAKTICLGATYALPWGGTVSTAGTYADTLRYAGGCDSLIRTVVLTVQSPTTNTSTVVICQGQTHTLPWGLQVGAAGTYRDTLTSIYGCDSLITNVQVVVQAPTTQNLQGYICQGQSFTLPWGQTVGSPGTYRDTLHYASGCDSLIKIYTLTLAPLTVEHIYMNLCYGQTFNSPQGGFINQSGVLTDTLKYVNGCDSVHKIYHVTIASQVVINASSITICPGRSYTLPWGGEVAVSGTYSDTLRNFSGCDSVIKKITLVVSPPANKNIAPSICEGSTYVFPWGGQTNLPGNYNGIVHTPGGCDTNYIVTLQVVPPIRDTVTKSVCYGASFEGYSGTGTFSDTFPAANGCDSIRVLRLTVRQQIITNINQTICPGDSYLGYSHSGTYQDTLTAANGCDSIRILQLTVRPVVATVVTQTICEGSSFEGYTQSGSYVNHFTMANGCDSARTLHLTVNAKSNVQLQKTICYGENFMGHTESGTYLTTGQNINGCDSTHTLFLTVQPQLLPNLGLDREVCENNTDTLYPGAFYGYNWSTGVTAPYIFPTNAGVYWVRVNDIAGCKAYDSIKITKVYPSPTPSITKMGELCSGGGSLKLLVEDVFASYLWSDSSTNNNIIVYQPGHYHIAVTDTNGCIGQKAIQVVAINCGAFSIPNAFTPNADNLNDTFKPLINGQVTNYHFVVWNRWGVKLFESTTIGNGWNGLYKGERQNIGAYLYQVSYKDSSGKQQTQKGSFILIR